VTLVPIYWPVLELGRSNSNDDSGGAQQRCEWCNVTVTKLERHGCGGGGNPPTIGGAHEGIAVDGRLPPQWEEVEQAPTAARVQEDATWRVARS
jgi:hypothetical protein